MSRCVKSIKTNPNILRDLASDGVAPLQRSIPSMNSSRIKALITALLWIAATAGARSFAGSESGFHGKVLAHCDQGCCVDGQCACSMGSKTAPGVPSPALPPAGQQTSKLMLSATQVVPQDRPPPVWSLISRAVIKPGAARPFQSPALTLNCALLL